MPRPDPTIDVRSLLKEMYDDGYFPDFLVDKVGVVLTRLSAQIGEQRPADTDGLLELTHAATEEVNALQEAFWDNDSEIETAARDCIGMAFDAICRAYGYDVDVEEVIAPRDW